MLVTALALVIALGTGVYAGLGSTTAWRIRSNDLSYASLQMHDLRVQLPEGAFAPQGTLRAAASEIPDASSVAVASERLVAPTLVDASAGDDELLVPGEVVGMTTGRAGVDALHVDEGRGLLASDEQRPVAVLESKFAAAHSLPATGTVLLGAGSPVTYVGTGYTPEYFQVVGRTGMVLGEASFAVVFMPLRGAQEVSGHVGQVNDLAVRLRPGADLDQVREQLTAAVAPYGGTVTTKAQDPVRRALYEDARNDQTTWNIFAFLILFGAAFAAFNLITRMIESQRREIGIGMALGVPPSRLALRPVLVGVQISLLGVVAGVGVGWATGAAMGRVMTDLLPLPIWQTPFQTGRFARAAVLGLAIPLLATVVPILRALRTSPVEAIRSGAYGSARPAGRLLQAAARARLPGRSWTVMSLRNVLRAPRRSLLTALGVAAAMTSLVAVLGMLDTFGAAARANEAEVGREHPDRLVVTLDTFHPEASPAVRRVARAPGVEESEPQLAVASELVSEDGPDVETVVRVVDLGSPVWTPTLVDDTGAADGIVLSEKAAADLGVEPGDSVELRHPVLRSGELRLETSAFEVRALHPDPWRIFAYLDAGAARRFGLAGWANQVVVVPAGDVDQLRRSLFRVPGVTAVESAASFATVLDQALEQFTGILRVIEVAAVALALLIAFNSASITADERTREHATMFAFGVPPRTVTGMAVVENALIGLFGTLVGLAGGFAGLSYIVSGFDDVMPDLLVEPVLSTGTAVTALVLGVVVVALSPVLGARRQRRMDIPASLRVTE